MEKDIIQIKKDLEAIKLVYLDRVNRHLKSLSEDINEHLNKTMVRIKDFFETNTNFFIQLSEENKDIISGIETLKENQADQLETMAQTRDGIESIVKIDLNNLSNNIDILRNDLHTSYQQLEEKINSLTTQIVQIDKRIQTERKENFQLMSGLAEKIEKQGEQTINKVNTIAALVLQKKREE